jgi:hypothetical protein
LASSARTVFACLWNALGHSALAMAWSSVVIGSFDGTGTK